MKKKKSKRQTKKMTKGRGTNPKKGVFFQPGKPGQALWGPGGVGCDVGGGQKGKQGGETKKSGPPRKSKGPGHPSKSRKGGSRK